MTLLMNYKSTFVSIYFEFSAYFTKLIGNLSVTFAKQLVAYKLAIFKLEKISTKLVGKLMSGQKPLQLVDN